MIDDSIPLTWHYFQHNACFTAINVSRNASEYFDIFFATRDRMHSMIQTEARLFIFWLCFLYACLPNWKYAAAKIHMHFLEGNFKEAIFFRFSRVARSLETAAWWYHAYAMYYSRGYNITPLLIR